jgi:hypothetical protein
LQTTEKKKVKKLKAYSLTFSKISGNKIQGGKDILQKGWELLLCCVVIMFVDGRQNPNMIIYIVTYMGLRWVL